MAQTRYTHRNKPDASNESIKPDRASQDRRRQWGEGSSVCYRTPGLRHCAPLLDLMGGIHARHPASAGVWPSQALLAEMAGGRDVSVIKRQLRKVAKAGILIKEVRPSHPDPDKGGRLTRPTNYYRVDLRRVRELRAQHRDRVLAQARRQKEQAAKASAAGQAYGASAPHQSPLRGEVTPGAVPMSTPPPPEWASTSPEWVHSPPTDAGRHAIREARAQLRGKRC